MSPTPKAKRKQAPERRPVPTEAMGIRVRLTRPGQKTFRADAELLARLDNRAQKETALLGIEVGASDIIRRGLDWALAQPLPGQPHRKPCLVVPRGTQGHKVCLICKADSAPGQEGPECPNTDMEPAL